MKIEDGYSISMALADTMNKDAMTGFGINSIVGDTRVDTFFFVILS